MNSPVKHVYVYLQMVYQVGREVHPGPYRDHSFSLCRKSVFYSFQVSLLRLETRDGNYPTSPLLERCGVGWCPAHIPWLLFRSSVGEREEETEP